MTKIKENKKQGMYKKRADDTGTGLNKQATANRREGNARPHIQPIRGNPNANCVSATDHESFHLIMCV